MPFGFIDRHRTALRATLAVLAALWLAGLYFLPTGSISRSSLGLFLVLPVAIASLLHLLWYDAWFRRMRWSPASARLAKGFFWLSAAGTLVLIVAMYVVFVFG